MDDLRKKYLDQVAGAADEGALEEVRLAALGKKGEVALMMRTLGQMSAEDRQEAGPRFNALRDEIDTALKARRTALADAALDERLKSEWLDVTLPGRPRPQGTIHPVSQVSEEITAIFADMGFRVAEGPQIESDWYNFDALNIAPEHPARQEHDTFFMARAEGDDRPPHVLRTHTSPVQIRSMQEHGAPIRVIAPGRTYRMDMDQTHSPMFHQIEGLAVDRDISMANLKWVLEEFFTAYFGTRVKTRFRASHFPFTEPSAEVDIQCSWIGGQLKIGEGDGLDGGARVGHGASEGADRRRHRPRPVAGLRLRHGDRPDGDAEVRHPGSARVLRERPALAEALWLRGTRRPDPEGRRQPIGGRHAASPPVPFRRGTSRRRPVVGSRCCPGAARRLRWTVSRPGAG